MSGGDRPCTVSSFDHLAVQRSGYSDSLPCLCFSSCIRSVGYFPLAYLGVLVVEWGWGLAASSKHHKYGVSMDDCVLWLGLVGVGFPGSEAEGNAFAHGSCFPLAFGLCAGCAGLCCIILFFPFCKHLRGVPHAYSGPRVTYLSSRHDGNESPFPTNAFFLSLSGSTPSTAHPLLPTPIHRSRTDSAVTGVSATEP